jgi:SagB-type dehydrogenase family enzyme
MMSALDQVLRYHIATKHHFNSFARGPKGLDWANQPNPFRQYVGAPMFMLDREGELESFKMPLALNLKGVSHLFFYSLALSAWKSIAGSTWSLRVNPSSGNLHPTEVYLITGPVNGLEKTPGVFHYSSKDHALELRFELKDDEWNQLSLPDGTILLALTSIYWRESWKYGERALRYCMHDIGHALAAISVAASCLGWPVSLQDEIGCEDISRLLGIAGANYWEAEHPDCLLAIFTDGKMHDVSISSDALKAIKPEGLHGSPNNLSAEHVDWSIIYDTANAISKPPTQDVYSKRGELCPKPSKELCGVIRNRRSAQAMDGRTVLSLNDFYNLLRLTRPNSIPFCLLPWRPYIDLAFFIHRVQGLENGLYMLARDESRVNQLIDLMNAEFAWERVNNSPDSIDFYFLARGDVRLMARQSSCHQHIASDGCFAIAMLAEFEEPLQEVGPWLYPRLYWECGMIGQILYLGAEANHLSGCGIGCFFDDSVHEILGLRGMEFQDLYHFAVGKALEDKRILTLPAYN